MNNTILKSLKAIKDSDSAERATPRLLSIECSEMKENYSTKSLRRNKAIKVRISEGKDLAARPLSTPTGKESVQREP